VPDWAAFVAMGESFTTATSYDALGRVVQIDTPHNTNVPASQVLPIYNEANLLNQVDVKLRGSTTATTFVSNIDYDAKGQRQRIQYGNGSTTRYDHDPLTYRLTRLLTTRNSGADTLQDLDYTYDPSGNVMQITDAAQQTVFFNNAVVNPTALYEYDALYRLTKATGREHVSNGATTEPEAEGFNPAQALPGDGAALRNYTRQWSYDQVGNILSLIHTANAGSWNRSYAYASDSNRLSTTTVGQTTDSYSHNAFGSFTTMPHLDALDWDHNEHLNHVKRGTSETWYVYDSTGQRVRKLTEKPGQSEERLYLGGFEIYRKSQSGTVTLERETLHIMDGVKRIALVETRTIGSDSSAAQTIRYQLDNHLQSATLELDESAALISYEEYYPYGDTSYQSGRNQAEVQRKRYRYTGKEKDEETGLYYHGARYYAPWLGRWTAADPAGMVDGACLYAYVRNHPTGLIDPDGRAGETPFPLYNPQDRLKPPSMPRQSQGVREMLEQRIQQNQSRGTFGGSKSHAIHGPTLRGPLTAAERNNRALLEAFPTIINNPIASVAFSAHMEAGHGAVVAGRSAQLMDAGTPLLLMGAAFGVNRTQAANSDQPGLVNVMLTEAKGIGPGNRITNKIPMRGARAIPSEFVKGEKEEMLSGPGKCEAWVTAADDLKGINTAEGLAKRLTLLDNKGDLLKGPFTIVEFDMPLNAIASPIRRTQPGFVSPGTGLTAGKAREFVIPNQAIDDLKKVTKRGVK